MNDDITECNEKKNNIENNENQYLSWNIPMSQKKSNFILYLYGHVIQFNIIDLR